MEDIKKYVNEQEKILYDELFNLSLDVSSILKCFDLNI